MTMKEAIKETAPSPTVLVVGSANMDLVVSCRRFPKPGETLLADHFGMYPGGKGANQAVACARQGGDVLFLAKLGRDPFAERLRESLAGYGVRLDGLLSDEAAATGVALITVDEEGENQIIVASGSNMRLQPEEVEACRDLFARARVVLLQLEVPIESVVRAAAMGRDHGALVVLNTAPAQPLPVELLANIDILTANETEVETLTGQAVTDDVSAAAGAERLLALGVGAVIVTMGEQGSLLVTAEEQRRFPARRVEVVDTTGAGDAFTGGLAFALASGWPMGRAIAHASDVAALAVTRRGAQDAMPTRAELEAATSTAHGSG